LQFVLACVSCYSLIRWKTRFVVRINDGPALPWVIMLRQHEIEIRVRYQETDAQGRVHHANYFNYFEMGRIELLRAAGLSYREIEQQGWMLVVSNIQCRYFRPANYDDIITLTTTTTRAKGARIEHAYRITCDGELLAEGSSQIACVDQDGNVCRLPEQLQVIDT